MRKHLFLICSLAFLCLTLGTLSAEEKTALLNNLPLLESAGLEMDVDARLAVCPGVDGDVLRGLPGLAAHVLADVEGPGGLSGQVGDFFQQLCVDLGDHERASSRFSTGHPPRVSARISGSTYKKVASRKNSQT